MGSPFHLILYADDSSYANLVATKTYLLIDSLNNIFSDYDADSELSKLNRTAGADSFVIVSPILYNTIIYSIKSYKSSNGAFDISIGALSKLWRAARKTGRFPTMEEVKNAENTVGMNHIYINKTDRSIGLMKAGMALDFGGIAKGMIAQAAIDFLTEKGIKSALADAGGDIVCSEPPPDKDAWHVAVNLPGSKSQLMTKQLGISNASVATSGDIFQFLEHKGKRYSHIINPKTGYGVTKQRNVTIIANNGTLADWLATACSILSPSEALQLAKEYEADIIIVERRNNKLNYKASDRIKFMMLKK